MWLGGLSLERYHCKRCDAAYRAQSKVLGRADIGNVADCMCSSARLWFVRQDCNCCCCIEAVALLELGAIDIVGGSQLVMMLMAGG